MPDEYIILETHGSAAVKPPSLESSPMEDVMAAAVLAAIEEGITDFEIIAQRKGEAREALKLWRRNAAIE